MSLCRRAKALEGWPGVLGAGEGTRGGAAVWGEGKDERARGGRGSGAGLWKGKSRARSKREGR